MDKKINQNSLQKIPRNKKSENKNDKSLENK